MQPLEFEQILPRLLATYEEGRLVPFIGAGLSVPVARGWEGLIEGLERSADVRRRPPGRGADAKTPPEELVRRANTAVRRLRARDPKRLVQEVRAALYGESGRPPAQTGALARIWWPLVVTTNYDDCLAAAFDERHAPRRLDVLGRSPADCQRVLSSLTEPSRALLWAVQGFAGGPCDEDPARFIGDARLSELERQLVVGHEEYRRVTYRELHFRRAFAEVYRSRSLLFLGSGIRESYLQELFGEILETYGPSGRPHYALMIRDEADPGFVQFMRSRFQTVVVPYDDHAELPKMLGRLASWIDSSSRRATSWSFGSPRTRKKGEWDNVEELEVVRGPLPLERAEGACLAVSAGGDHSLWTFGKAIAEHVLRAWKVDPLRKDPQELTPYLGYFERQHVFAVRAKSDADERGLQHIYRASRDLFRHAARLGYSRVHMQLLAAGGSELPTGDLDVESWRARTFPERFSFIQIVRSYGDWLASSRKGELALSIHLIAAPVFREVASGRLDVLELLSCHDTRFWAEVHDESPQGGTVLSERRLFQLDPKTPLRDVVKDLDLPTAGWDLEVQPAPNLLELNERDRAVEPRLDAMIFELGVVPGSTLHFRRSGDPQGSAGD